MSLVFSSIGIAAGIGIGTAGVSWYNSSQNVEKKRWQSLEDQSQAKTDAILAEGEALKEKIGEPKRKRKRVNTILTGSLSSGDTLGRPAPTLTGTQTKTTIG